MKGHRYRITVEHLATPNGALVDTPPLVFETTNHDDLFAIVEKIRARVDIRRPDVEPLAIGLKLLSEVALQHRKTPLFAQLQESLGAFIGKLKDNST